MAASTVRERPEPREPRRRRVEPLGSAWPGPGDDGRAMTSLLAASTSTAPVADGERRSPAPPTAGPAGHPRRRRGRRGHARWCAWRSAWSAGSSPTPAPTASPRDGLRVGALGWLLAHGSGVTVDGVAITAVPLGSLTLVAAWAVWRIGHRVGDSISGHGPDADAIADGERDWTVPVALALFTAGYVVVTVHHLALAATADDRTRTPPRVCSGRSLICVRLRRARARRSARAGPRSGRRSCRSRCARPRRLPRILGWLPRWSPRSRFLVALAVDFGTAANVMSQLHIDGGDATLFLLATALLAAQRRRSSPAPTCSAPASRSAPAPWSRRPWSCSARCRCSRCSPRCPTTARRRLDLALMAVPPLVAALAAARAQRRHPTLRWEEGALRGCAGGVLAGLLLGLLAAVAGGAVGPGRMRDVEPVRVRRPGARDHRVRDRRPGRRPGHDLVAPALGPPRRRAGLDSTLRRVPTSSPARLVVLVSGSGTNLQALLDACTDPAYGARVVAVGADRDGIEGLARAERAGIPTFVRKVARLHRPGALGPALTDTVAGFEPDLVVLAGFMKLVGDEFLGSLRRAGGQHPPGAVAVVPGHARPGRRPGVRREGHRLHALRGRRWRRHRPDRRAGGGAGRGRRRRRDAARADQGGRAGDAGRRPWAGWPARASRSRVGR